MFSSQYSVYFVGDKPIVQNKAQKKSSLWSHTYSWTKIIPFSRIWAIELDEQAWWTVMVDHFMVHNFKIWWVIAYRAKSRYWNKYKTSVKLNQQSPWHITSFLTPSKITCLQMAFLYCKHMTTTNQKWDCYHGVKHRYK